MAKVAAITLLFLLGLSSPASARTCIVPYIKTLHNQTSYGTMYATSGQRCAIRILRSPGPTFNTRLVANAKNGVVRISGHSVIYASRPGYVGDDHFVYSRQGLDERNQQSTRTVDITVKVATRW